MLLICFLLAFLFPGKCILAEEVTHMPVEQEPVIAQRFLNLMKNEVISNECQRKINSAAELRLYRLQTLESRFTQHISPCEACNMDGVKTFHVPDCGVKIAPDLQAIGEEGILMHVFAEFKELNITCKLCHMVNDAGMKVTGDLDAVWTNGKAELIFHKEYEQGNEIRVLFINATNVNRDTVKVECFGDEPFQKICTQTHESGELDHIFLLSAERLFTLEEDSILAKEAGSAKEGEKHLSDLFPCIDETHDEKDRLCGL